MALLKHVNSKAKLSDGSSNGALSLLFEATDLGDQENFIKAVEKSQGVLGDIALVSFQTPYHIASALGHISIVRDVISRKPGLSRELNQDGYCPIHLASSIGHLEAMKALIRRTPHHCAAMVETLDVVMELLGACPESIMALNARRETAIHVVVYNQCEAVQLLVERLLQMNTLDLINHKDRGSNSVLYLATSRKQFQTLQILLAGNPTIRPSVNLNAMNFGGFTALDILDVPSLSEDSEMEIYKTLQRPGALDSRDIAKPTIFHNNQHEVLIDFKSDWKKTPYEIINSSEIFNRQPRHDIMLLSLAAVMATITFYGAEQVYKYEKEEIVRTYLFILFNSTGFYTSVAMIIYITRDLPMKLWLLISMASLLGSYTCLTVAISEDINLNVFFLVSPAVLLAVALTFTVSCFSGHKC